MGKLWGGGKWGGAVEFLIYNTELTLKWLSPTLYGWSNGQKEGKACSPFRFSKAPRRA